MSKPVVALEISSTKLKVVVGYISNDKVNILYAVTKSIGHLCDGGTFPNRNTLIKQIVSMKTISDASMKLKFDLNDVLLSIPSYGIEVFNTKQTTTVIGEEFHIGNLDFRNLFSLIKNGHLPTNNELVDIIPDSFIVDSRDEYLLPPYQKVGHTLTMLAKVFTLPPKLCESYVKAVEESHVKVKRTFVSSFASGNLISSYPGIPKDYILVDIGSHITTVSLIGNGSLFGSRYFDWGGNNITEKVVKSFNISEEDAEKYKILYGIDTREMRFKTPICSIVDGDGNTVNYYPQDLNSIINKELDVFAQRLNIALDYLFEGYDAEFKKLPMVLIGGGSQLHGLVDFLNNKVTSSSITPLIPTTLGARDPGLFNCLGMIYANEKYESSFTENRSSKVDFVKREKE